MTDRPSPTLEDVFRALDSWRHLPAYRLEPNLAPFFGLFLRDILRECLKIEVHCTIIPEFPLRLGTLYPERENQSRSGKNQSIKVDYAVLEKNRERVFFVELKTDKDSFNESQWKRLCHTQQKIDFNCLLCGVLEMCKVTDKKSKYLHLLQSLKSMDLIEFSDGTAKTLYDLVLKDNRKGWSDTLKSVTPAPESPEIKIVYITPSGAELIKGDCKKENFHEVGFGRVAKVVRERGGIGYVFANYLEMWKSAAGAADPQEFRTAP